MLIYISILPIYSLLVHGVTGADFNQNKRVPRRHTKFTRTYDANHPPTVEFFDQIPVTVVYDDEDVIKVKNNNIKKADVIIEDEIKYLKHATNGGTAINLETPSVNHPPSHDMFPFSGINDYEEESVLKPKARSIKVSESKETKLPLISSAESENRIGNKTRRRTQQVRKMKVDKSQLEVYVHETEITDNKGAQKESITRTEETHANKLPVILQTFKRRKQLREPVVPIIESESYVFSHSGNFHYSYEGGDGTKAYERGELRSFNGGAGSAVEGNYSYKDKDGNDISLSYTADENGYRPVGEHLPTPPPIPPAIQRALKYLATKPTPEPITERIKTSQTSK